MKPNKRIPDHLIWLMFGLLALVILAACVPEPPAPIRQEALKSIPGSGGSGSETPPGPSGVVTAAIAVADQEFDGSSVVVPRVVSEGPGWVAINSQLDGAVGPLIGYAHLDEGVNLNVLVPVDSSQVTPVLYASLYVDSGEVGAFENPSPDTPVEVNGNPVSLSFRTGPGADLSPTAAVTASVTVTETSGTATVSPTAATQTSTPDPTAATTTVTPDPKTGATPTEETAHTPLVKVSDQVLDSWEVSIDQVTSLRPGWVVVYAMANGKSDEEIGRAPVKEGINRNVKVKIDSQKTTGTLFALLHVDNGIVGTYENPGADVAVVVGTKLIGTDFIIRLREHIPTETLEPGKPKPQHTKETTPIIVETTPVAVETTPVVVETTPVTVETTPADEPPTPQPPTPEPPTPEPPTPEPPTPEPQPQPTDEPPPPAQEPPPPSMGETPAGP